VEGADPSAGRAPVENLDLQVRLDQRASRISKKAVKGKEKFQGRHYKKESVRKSLSLGELTARKGY